MDLFQLFWNVLLQLNLRWADVFHEVVKNSVQTILEFVLYITIIFKVNNDTLKRVQSDHNLQNGVFCMFDL